MRMTYMVVIIIMTGVMLISEWQHAKTTKGKMVAGCITIATSILAIVLLFHPTLPGPTQFVKLLFGKVDMLMK